jgi:hypothetical protein
MIHSANANIQPQSNPLTRRLLAFGTGALAAALVGLALAPAAAQTPAQAASGSGKRAETPAQRTVKPTAPGKTPRSPSDRRHSRQAVMTPSRVVLVFPTDTKGGVSDQLVDVIVDTIQGRIAASGRYQSVYFLRSIPTVARALNEATLTNNEVSHPYDDDTKLRKLMPYSGYDMALTTSIDSYTYDAAKNQVTLLISARLMDFRGEKPVVRAAAENGSSPENGGNAKELTLATQVAKSIAEKLMTSLLSQERPMQTGSPAK